MADVGNIFIFIEEISASLVISEGTPPPDISQSDEERGRALYDNIWDELKEENGGIWRPPNAYNFPSFSAYELYLPEANQTIEELDASGAINRANTFNAVTDENEANRLGVFVRFFCKISLLFFLKISIGLIAENFGDGLSANSWTVAGQFQIDLSGLQFSVSISTAIYFDSRRHRHLGNEEYGRALAADGLQEAVWDAEVSFSCVPNSFCEAIVEFFKDIGEAIWEGLQAIGTFFADDVAGFINDAIDTIGEWGVKFAGAIVDTANKIANDIENIFSNGEVAQLLDTGIEAFSEDAKKAVRALSDGKFELNDVLLVGKGVLQGVILGVEFIIAGVTDVVNAIGSFFQNVGEAIADWLGLGKPWDELRTSHHYAPKSCLEECRKVTETSPDDKNQIKRNCWCTDEFECPVKVPEVRTCRVKSYFLWTETKCSGWRYVDIMKGGQYPRFDGRKFDKACREERMAKLAKANGYHQEAAKTSSLIDRNFQSNFHGLSNFSPKARLRRSLREGVDSATTVGEVSFAEFQVTENGVPGRISVEGIYDGARLQPDSTSVDSFSSSITAEFDFSNYKYPGELSQSIDAKNIMHATQKAAAIPYLESLKTDDPDFISRQPIIEGPKLSQAGKAGSIEDPIVIECSEGNLASAWLDKLESFEPEALRRNRARRLSSQPIQETLVDIVVENILRDRILNKDGIDLRVKSGNVIGVGSEDDIFLKAKKLLGTEGAGSFMNPENVVARRRLQPSSLSDYKLELLIMRSEPFCDHFEWTFEVTVADYTGKSNSISIEAQLFYGASEIGTTPPSFIQTRCDSTPYGVEELEDNKALLQFTGVTSFKPLLRADKCPSPFIYLSADSNMDTVINEGEPCTTNYKVVQRDWSLVSHDDRCPVQITQNPFFVQTITLGGFLSPENGEPATPVFDLRNKNYYLPNEPRARVGTRVEDFYANNIAPISECGICSDPEKAIVYSHPEDFVCNEEGENIISVRVLNQIGVELKKEAVATVFDNFPPNMITKEHTVNLNEFGWLDERDKVKVNDINDGTWDNCGIKGMSVNPTPIYQCNDEGPQTIVLTAVDKSINNEGRGNMNSQDQIIYVDDSSRLGIGDDEYLQLPKNTKKLAKKQLKEKFNYDYCKEIGVYVRPEGETNFLPLDYSSLECFEGFVGKIDWEIPELDVCDSESILFHSSICKSKDKNMFSGCKGEIKAEVLCRDRGSGKGKGKGKGKGNMVRKQTCYRAKLLTGSKKGGKGKKCKGKGKGKSSACKGKKSRNVPRGYRLNDDENRAHFDFDSRSFDEDFEDDLEGDYDLFTDDIDNLYESYTYFDNPKLDKFTEDDTEYPFLESDQDSGGGVISDIEHKIESHSTNEANYEDAFITDFQDNLYVPIQTKEDDIIITNFKDDLDLLLEEEDDDDIYFYGEN